MNARSMESQIGVMTSEPCLLTVASSAPSLLHVSQIRDGAGVGKVAHGWKVLVDRFEAGIDDVLGLDDVDVAHESADQVAKGFAGNGRNQTGSGRTAAGQRSRRLGDGRRSHAD